MEEFIVSDDQCGRRLDVYLAELTMVTSRAQAQKAIGEKRVFVNREVQKAAYRVSAGDVVGLEVVAPVPCKAQAETIPLEILFEDEWVVVVNKPAGMVVHPACGNRSGTLVNALLSHCEVLSGIGGVLRPGIVHRIDKGTSGVLVVAKNDTAHVHLSAQFQQHTIVRKYKALVFGAMEESSGTISGLIGRHMTDRKKMSTRTRRGKHAVTHWHVDESFAGATLLSVMLETGRTHQIRVHLSSIGRSIVGDPVYGSPKQVTVIRSKRVQDTLKGVRRPMLHAGFLQFEHPATAKMLSFEVPMPDDFSQTVACLRNLE
ncbi:MAG: RluA family pseudouridine synthase [Deltaproteobacteria bacterium]|nr:RluA family pseudouridine synthase [Deltaproteobacteria bacterium]